MIRKISSRWWFFIILLIVFFIPPLTEVSFDSSNTNSVIAEVLHHPFIYNYELIYGFIKIGFLVMIILLKFNKPTAEKVFNYFIPIVLISIALFQNSSKTSTYGMTILLGNLILNLIVALFWFYHIFRTYENRIRKKIGYIKYLLIGLALLAFWFPADITGKHPSFTLIELLINESMVTFCMVIPVILVVAILFFNRINLITLKVTSFIGLLFGIVNMITWFIMDIEMWWMGILHIPLLIISLYVFIVSRKELKEDLSDISLINID